MLFIRLVNRAVQAVRRSCPPRAEGAPSSGRLWVYACDQWSWAGPEPPAAVYVFAHDRKAERPAAHLTHLKGILHVDGYAGFYRLTDAGNIILAACWAYTRRKSYEVAQSQDMPVSEDMPVAHEALRRIASLYAVEAQVHGQSAAHRLAMRHAFAKPIVDSLRPWLEMQPPQLPGRGNLGEAIGYALSHWDGLTRFLHECCIELDTNSVERAIRPVAFGRKNNLFDENDGGRERRAILCSLIATCMPNHVELYAFLRGMLQRMVDGLLPWNGSPAGLAAGTA
ncbi:IS66 family transposase [Bradyrhizobium sp. CCBAU 53421]|uniref:IS66 family transposase n=1 Tax=Bradyrhizobium sp. CCBAU 53421 TaxID=1325120 RepID=UPI0018C0ED6D|nr:IS66 family transposase [Bradyrhizobium sp. CCBAU 53421]QOZ36135.1 IS66 family transposase [Bradyrhizobium sp. CCBAU 53421]